MNFVSEPQVVVTGVLYANEAEFEAAQSKSENNETDKDA